LLYSKPWSSPLTPIHAFLLAGNPGLPASRQRSYQRRIAAV
jgi:hypothetical protein